jgi:hypothetical protein
MYENDYSWVPGFLAGFVVVAVAGGITVALIRPNQIRKRVLIAWLTMPISMSVGLGVLSALIAQNIEPYTPIFLPIFLSIILLPPWLMAAAPAFGLCRYLQSRLAIGKR